MPAASGGLTAVMLLDELTVKLVAGTPPKRTSVAAVKLLPLMPTLVPPVVLPLLVPSDEMLGRWRRCR